MLTTHLNLGGIGVYVFSLARGLVQKGHCVFVASSGGSLLPFLESSGVRHITIDIKTKSEISPKVFFAQKDIIPLIKKENIEIIHAHTRVTQVMAHLIYKKTGVAYVTTCHGFFRPRIFRKIFPCWGERVIAISEAVREHLVNDFGVRKEKTYIVHNGVEMEKFSPEKFSPEQKEEIKRDYGLASNAPIIGTIARLSSIKGHSYLISAMKKILKVIPAAQLLLVGDGPERKRLINQVEKTGIKNRVFFKPSTFDTSVPLSVMDVFVFPSLMEGLGLGIIEAQAMGLPVVATDVGGIYTLVKDGVNGYLVHPKDAQGLQEAILRLLKDRNLAIEMGKRGREQAERRFNLRQMIDGIERIYMEVER